MKLFSGCMRFKWWFCVLLCCMTIGFNVHFINMNMIQKIDDKNICQLAPLTKVYIVSLQLLSFHFIVIWNLLTFFTRLILTISLTSHSAIRIHLIQSRVHRFWFSFTSLIFRVIFLPLLTHIRNFNCYAIYPHIST